MAKIFAAEVEEHALLSNAKSNHAEHIAKGSGLWEYPRSLPVLRKTDVLDSFVPALPQPFALEKETKAAKSAIFVPAFASATCPTAIIAGPQACGKTTVAIALARDQDIQGMFPDGVLWTHCGANASAQGVLRQMLEVLRAVDERHCQKAVPFLTSFALSPTDELVARLALRRILIVLDDLRDAGIVRACNVLGPHLLATTCVASIAKRLRTSSTSASVTVYQMQAIGPPAVNALLQSQFDFTGVPPSQLEELRGMLGQLPLEVSLTSFLFRLVDTYVQYDRAALVTAVCKRLQASHKSLQEQMDNEQAVAHLSESHQLCWRTLAVTLELLPSSVRRALFQLAAAPPGAALQEELLAALWQLPHTELAGMLRMFSSISVLHSVRTVAGRTWHLANVAQDYLLYWVRMSGKGPTIGRLQRWLLERPEVAVRVCNPFSENAHLPLVRRPAAGAEVALLSAAALINSDDALSSAAKAALASPATREGACLAVSLAAAAYDARKLHLAVQLLQDAVRKFEAELPAGQFACLRCQLEYQIATVQLECGEHAAALALLATTLAAVKRSADFAPPVQHQLLASLVRGAFDARDSLLALSLAQVRSQMVEAYRGTTSAHHVSALIYLAHSQLFNKETPQCIKQTIKIARNALESNPDVGIRFSKLHLTLERIVVAYYLYIGRIDDVEAKVCKLYMQVQALYDTHHEASALLMNDIALCLNMQGNFNDAHDMLRETIGLFSKASRDVPTELTCALAHNNLAISLVALGRGREAITHVRQALRVLTATNHPFVCEQPTHYLRAVVLMHYGEYDAAKSLLKEVVRYFSLPEHRSLSATSAALETLGVLYIARREWTEAAEALEQSLTMSGMMAAERQARLFNAVETAKPFYLLAFVHSQMGATAKAEKCRMEFERLRRAHSQHPYMLWFQQAPGALEQLVRGGNSEASPADAGSGSTLCRSRGRHIISDPELKQLNGQVLANDGASI